jgi:hypothetical protein
LVQVIFPFPAIAAKGPFDPLNGGRREADPAMPANGVVVRKVGIEAGLAKDVRETRLEGVPAMGTDLGVKEVDQEVAGRPEHGRSHVPWTNDHQIVFQKRGSTKPQTATSRQFALTVSSLHPERCQSGFPLN